MKNTTWMILIFLIALSLAACQAKPEAASSEPSITEILNLVLASHTRWKSVEGTARTIWRGENAEVQQYTTEFSFIQPARAQIKLIEVPEGMDRITWTSDGVQITEINIDKGTHSQSNLPNFAGDTRMLPKDVNEVESDTVYLHPLTLLVPSPVAEYIFPHGFAQGVGKGTYALVGEEQVAGRETWIMTVTIRENFINAWIDQETGVILKYLQQGSIPELDFEVLEINFDLQQAEGDTVMPSEAALNEPPQVNPAFPDFPLHGWRMLAFGENGILLVRGPGNDEPFPIHLPSESFGPSFSPSGDRIAYWRNYGVEIIDLATGETIRVGTENYGGFGSNTAWSPNETHIAVGCAPAETHPISEVCLFDLASGEMQTLTDLTNYSTDVYTSVDIGNWATRGNLLAFNLSIPPVSDGSSYSLIFVLDLDTGKPRLLFDERAQSTYTKLRLLQISPDGTKILFTAEVNGGSDEVLLVDVATGALTQLTHSPNGHDIIGPLWLDNETFTAATYSGNEKIAQLTYNLSGAVIGSLDIPESWNLIAIQQVE